jgi:hypothetical protein
MTTGLALSLVTTTAGATTATKAPAATPMRCEQLRKRLAGAPATLRRVDAGIVDLRTRLGTTRIPARRAVLEQRIQQLEQLRAELQSKVAEARAVCSTT